MAKIIYNNKKGSFDVRKASEQKSLYKNPVGFDVATEVKYKNVDTSDVDEKYVNSFLTDAFGYITAENPYHDKYTDFQRLQGQTQKISAWAYRNNRNLDPSTYDAILNTVDLLENNDPMRQFQSAEDYDSFFQDWKSYYNEFGHLKDRYDFDDLSQYKSTAKVDEDGNVVKPHYNVFSDTYDDTGYNDLWYEIINNNPEAIAIARDNKSANMGPLGNVVNPIVLSEEFLTEFTDEERAIYNYLYQTDPERAKQYIEDWTPELKRRDRLAIESAMREQAKNSPVVSSLFSVLSSPLKGLSYIGQSASYLSGQGIDQNDRYNIFVNANNAIRDEVSKDMGGFGKFLYNTGMSIADSLYARLLTGALPFDPSLAKTSKVLTQFIVASGAAADTVVSSKDMGLSDDQAFGLGFVAGGAEAVMEGISIDAFLNTDWTKGALNYVVNNVLSEGLEEVGTDVINLSARIVDFFLNKDKSEWGRIYQQYIDQGMSESEAKRKMIADNAKEIGLDFLGGGLSGGAFGVVGSVSNVLRYNAEYGDLAKDSRDLAGEALAINPDDAYAKKIQTKIDSGKQMTGNQYYTLQRRTEAAILKNDIKTIASNVSKRLDALGEKGDISALSNAIAKKLSINARESAIKKQNNGEILSVAEYEMIQTDGVKKQDFKMTAAENALIKKSKFGSRILNELNPGNIASGDYSTEWTKDISTDRIYPESYGLSSQNNFNVKAAESTQKEGFERSIKPSGENQNAQISRSVADAETESNNDSPAALKNISKKYGAQANAVFHTYQWGQDAFKFAGAFDMAYNMGKSGVQYSYVKGSESTSYLTENQKRIAFEMGQDAAEKEAEKLDSQNRSKTSSNQKRKKGKVIGDGVTIETLKKKFNDTQKNAYRILSFYAEATGIDIVLYESASDFEGNFTDAQGKFKRDNPGTIYIDINSGLDNIKNIGDLGKYTMIRTFAHEFVHFIENWNPVRYNEFRRVVFDELSSRGKNVNELIELTQKSSGLSYEKASREVVAEAMTDILPDSNFAKDLAENHKNIFSKLLEKFKEFVKDLKRYFNSLGTNRSAEANALKDQVGDAVRYAENIVKTFDRVATEAVENYQKTVSEDNITAENETVSQESTVTEDQWVQEQSRKWYPILDKDEWDIVNSCIKNMRGIELTDIDNMFYVEKNGKQVFGIYSTEDSVLLYASHKKTAEKEYRFVQLVMEDYNNGILTDTSAKGLNTWSKTVRMRRTANISHVGTTVAPGRLAGDAGLYGEPPRIYASAALRSVLKNIFEKADARRGRGIDSTNSQNETSTQYQERTSPLTDREILEVAANEPVLYDMKEGQRFALETYKKRLDHLRTLQEERAKLGKLYKDQQFGDNVNRKEAAQTLNRMKVLDSQIKRASESLLTAEEKEIMKPIIEITKKEILQREHDRNKKTIKRIREQQIESLNVKKYRASVEKNLTKLIEMMKHPTKDAHVPHILLEPLKSFLGSIDFSSKQAIKIGVATKKDDKYTSSLAKLRDVISNQRSALENSEDGLYSLDVPSDFVETISKHIAEIEDATKSLEKLSQNRIYMMNSVDLKELSIILSTINASIRKIDKLHMEGSKARVSEVAKSTMQEMGIKKPIKGEKGNTYVWRNYTPYYAFNQMGDGAMQIFHGLMKGQSKLAKLSKEIIDFGKKTYGNKASDFEKRVHSFDIKGGNVITDEYGVPIKKVNIEEKNKTDAKKENDDFLKTKDVTVKMSTAQIMALYLLAKRKQALGHILKGGIRMSTIGKGINEIVQKDHIRLTLNDIDNITSVLSPSQKEMADKIQKFMQNRGGELGNEISMARWDYAQFYENDYYPIKTDDVSRDVKNPEVDNANLWALINKSFTKDLTPNASNALVIDSVFETFADHMSDVAEYNAFALPLIDAMKWFNYRESDNSSNNVHKAIKDTLGTNAVSYFRDLMTDINSSQKAGRYEDFLGKFLSRMKVASIAWNLRVAIQQPTAILRASMVLGMPEMMKGVLSGDIKQLIKEMKEYSGIALWKSLGYFDVNISRSLKEQIKGPDNFLDKFNEAGMVLPGVADEHSWARIWAACKSKVSREKKLSGENLLKATAELFEDVIYQTQVVDSVLSRSGYMRSKSQSIRELTSFASEPTLSSNILINAYQNFANGGITWDKAKNGLYIAFTGYVLSSFANFVATTLFDALWRDESEDGIFEKLKKAAFGDEFFDGNFFEELNPLDKLVFFRDVLSIFKSYGWKSNEGQSSYAQVITSCLDLLSQSIKHFQGKGSLTDYGLLYKAMQSLSSVFGGAFSNTMREVSSMWNSTFGTLDPDLKLKVYEK